MTFKDISDLLARRGEMRSEAIAGVLCPELAAMGTMGGGPSRGQYKVDMMLGRMRQKGLSSMRIDDDGITYHRAGPST